MIYCKGDENHFLCSFLFCIKRLGLFASIHIKVFIQINRGFLLAGSAMKVSGITYWDSLGRISEGRE